MIKILNIIANFGGRKYAHQLQNLHRNLRGFGVVDLYQPIMGWLNKNYTSRGGVIVKKIGDWVPMRHPNYSKIKIGDWTP